ncbi:MAG TPA: hypothetical protein VNF27_09480 [Candidatus Binataceae bacterium]|nr:hypothetical protein [Candidatus Binataceae bacterium]
MRTRGILVWVALAAAIAVAGAGCSSDSADTQSPEAVSTPHFVNDLSAISAQPINPITDPSAAFAATHANGNSGSGRADEEAPGTVRHVGNDQNPGVEQLLNPKAAKFASFSGLLVHHLWTAVRKRENDDDIARLNLPSDLQPVVLTATMDSRGKLNEIVLEQHSGKGIVDRMFIGAAKKSLWATNPPREAAMPDGNYRVRVELKLENFASMGDGRWFFKTYVGLALL